MTSKRLDATAQPIRKFVHSTHREWLHRCFHMGMSSSGDRAGDWMNAYVCYDADASREAETVEGRLNGISIALKDNICTKKYKTTCSSAMLQDFVSPYDASVVRLLRKAGARIVGKTNCDEFGMGSFNTYSIHGPVVNPFQRLAFSRRERRSAGGSSGGSAAAVSSGSCFAALGTDTGGSIRLPAAYCGISGFKPSYGLISRWGVVSYADSLDCVGILAKVARDIGPIFEVLSCHDPKDPTSANEDLRKRASQACTRRLGFSKSLEGLLVGVPREYFPKELDESAIAPLRKLIHRLRDAGATIVPVSLPATRYALSAYYVIASAEASSNLARYSGIHYGLRVRPPPEADKKKVSNVYSYTRTKGCGHEVQKRILLGTYALMADAFNNYFLKAQRIRNLVKADFNRVFASHNPLSLISHDTSSTRVDVLLHPSAVGSAPLLAEIDKFSSLEVYAQDVLTVPASLAGLPALSVPAGLAKDGWPLGISIVGQWGHDELVLRIGDIVQQLAK